MDKEKIIKGLEYCAGNHLCFGCGYYDPDNARCQKDLMRDALELLKEQRPVMWSFEYNCLKCSNCDLHINDEVYYMMDKPISFCPNCGRKIKWDD